MNIPLIKLPFLRQNKTIVGSFTTKSSALNSLSIFLAPSIAIIISVILIIFVFIPQINEYQKTQQLLSESRTKINALQAKINVLNDVQLESYNSQLQTILKALPSETDYLLSIAQLQSIASTTRIQIADVNFSQRVGEGYTIRTEILGTIADVKRFIDSVNQAPRLMKVTNLEVNSGKNNFFLTNLTIQAYISPLPKITSQIDQAVPTLTTADLEFINRLSRLFADIPEASNEFQATNFGRADPFNQ